MLRAKQPIRPELAEEFDKYHAEYLAIQRRRALQMNRPAKCRHHWLLCGRCGRLREVPADVVYTLDSVCGDTFDDDVTQ